MRFRGYRRNDGRIGIRNHVLILPASICASDVAHQVTMQVQGTVSFHNQLGCSQTPNDQECTLRTMAGLPIPTYMEPSSYRLAVKTVR
jgi:altronate dehydratase large subunit